MANKLIKKIVYLMEASLVSPLCISNGDGELTDQDVIRDAQGKPFIPGSSLAGAMRGYINKASDEKCIFGYEKQNDTGRMSSVYVSDFQFVGDVAVTVRDSVALSPRKTAISGAKFDMEVIDTGAQGYFYMEMVVRSEDDELRMQEQLSEILAGWKGKDIRLGSKKTRGYGELRLDSVKVKEFDGSNILEYGDVYLYEKKDAVFLEESILDKFTDNSGGKFVTIQLPLVLDGGISIRQYSAEKGKPDFAHITANGKPVIPGTSMAGAIRHRIELVLSQLGVQNSKTIIDETFGFVDASRKDSKAHKSSIVVSESILEDSKALTLVRNGISRFEGGTKKGALFKELSYVGGRTMLEIKVEQCEETEAMVGFLLLALKDLAGGYLAVGGQTAVGRGLFMADGPIVVSGMDYSEELCFQKAFWALERKGE